jgi:serine/threonine protein kinase
MSGSGAVPKLITVGDFDPLTDQPLAYSFLGRTVAGRYKIHALIGGGGMADVYKATDERLAIDVAVKLLRPCIASDDLRARMIQEARAAAGIRHPNLVHVSDAGSFDATAFIVMALLVGEDLEHYLRERPDPRLPWDAALPLLIPAMEALHAIHERGYVHRDIKPANILVTCAPDHPTAVVIDLGLVKPDRALRTVDSPSTTAAGLLLCTPSYASPEQALGLPVDRRSDIYSLAMTLYRVLAGRLPCRSTTTTSRGDRSSPTTATRSSAASTRMPGPSRGYRSPSSSRRVV